MGWLLAAVLLLPVSNQVPPADALVSRPLAIAPIVVPDVEPASFDLIDFLEEQRGRTLSYNDVEHRSMFGFKKHIGIATGYDNGILHGSVGMYLTVAEWGRWNFGVMAPEIGLARYTAYDERRRQALTKTDYTLFISLASVHYRVGYLPSIGMNWYVNLEQIFDLRRNLPGSQIGVSFSSK
jgi:hypothetical protein